MAWPRISAPSEPRFALSSRALRAKICLVLLALFLVLSAAISLTAGASDASVKAVLGHYLGFNTVISGRDLLIIEQIRLPRVFLGMLVGAALAVSGAIMQGVFRNPLADPGLAGVSAGAGLGAAFIIVLGGTFALPFVTYTGFLALPLLAFVGSLATTASLYAVSTRHGRTSVPTMLLAGIAFGALAMAATGCLVYIADDHQIRDLSFWQLGSLAGATWLKVATLSAIMVLASTALPFMARGLNGLSMGEAVAGHMGIPVETLKRSSIVVVSAMTGGAVAVSGGIGFVGIVVPHVLRLAIGPDHRYLLPATALLGAALLVLADAVARIIVAPAELPIGIITALFGAPFFLWLLLKRRNLLDM
ncbi:FecCD family ABC transporter permease [Rhizobium oryziradicis]|uniref:Iron ABC transporter n=1 Tax=Rhizobium oryziradicis TaxID=1867956 RepID=A0A1Q8ZYA3_9HYPH|nr:iron ABC transporter permease [Rhizobium oryziradicis]OLP47004.1 iron ABC transporter [Rhizobium oryziradicis]